MQAGEGRGEATHNVHTGTMQLTLNTGLAIPLLKGFQR